MKVKYLFLTLVVSVMALSCKKDTNQQPDNIFKFRDYISYTTSGLVSTADPIKIDLAKEVDSWEPNKELSLKIIKISPEIDGKLTALNSRSLIFQPSKNLEQNTEYTVTILLHKIYNNVPEEFKTFTFKFKTIQQNFSINTTNFQSYNREWKYIEGLLKTTDILTLENAKTILSASQKNKNLKIKWNESDSLSTQFQFIIDSVQRFVDDSEVIIAWNGKKINVENKGESSFKIPGKNNFSILNVEVIQSPEQYLKINFSDPIKMQQNFDGLVEIQNNNNVTFTVDGNILKVFPSTRIAGNVQVEVFQGISSTDGYKLKNNFSEIIAFEQLKPQVRLVSSGVILPNSNDLKFNFEAVNLKAVDVRIIKIFENNILQFLQTDNLGSNN
uniref:Ig-like domain-containing protein n=1 Tax=Lutibacter sp. TaxID=1925666 RepID=UPI003563B85C